MKGELQHITMIKPGSVLLLLFMLGMQISTGYAQQALQFSQYYANQLILNPAYAGSEDALSMTMVHRHQWSGVQGAPKTTTLSGHTLFKNDHTGLGFNFFIDQINIHKNVNVDGVYSYRIKTGDHSYLNLGLQAGLYYVHSDYTSLGAGTSDDPAIGYENFKESAFQVGSGLFYNSKRIEIGLSAPILYSSGIGHMNKETSFLGTTPHFFLYARYKVWLSPDLRLNPGLLLRNTPGLPIGYDINLDAWIKEVLMLAVSYRTFETIISMIQVKVLPQMKFGYSIDFPLSASQHRNFNSHEFMLNYIFKYESFNVKSPR